MQQYLGVKRIEARSMSRRDYNEYRGWKLPKDENPNDEGYLVEYEGDDNPNHSMHVGYISWSPKSVFEKAYRKTEALTFGLAIEAAKLGHRIYREGWNGKEMFVYYVPAFSAPALSRGINEYFVDNRVPYRHYLALKTAQNDVATWSPSTSDALAEDWRITL